MAHDGYPESVLEVLDADMRFKPGVLKAMRSFKKSRPWSGSIEKRKEKFRRLNKALAGCYGRPAPDLVFERINNSSSARSRYEPAANRIVIVGRLSVVSFLHEFGHALGKGEWQACKWSINLFRKVIPREFERLVHRRHMLIRPEDL